MKIPLNATEATLWSYGYKSSEVLRQWCLSMGQSFRDKKQDLDSFINANKDLIAIDPVFASMNEDYRFNIDETPPEIAETLQQLDNERGVLLRDFKKWEKRIYQQHLKNVFNLINEQVEIARIGKHWSPEISEHVSNGEIHYPLGLNQDNEGSRGVFLIGLSHEFSIAGKDLSDPDMGIVIETLRQTKQDAINGTFHNPTLEDIINV